MGGMRVVGLVVLALVAGALGFLAGRSGGGADVTALFGLGGGATVAREALPTAPLVTAQFRFVEALPNRSSGTQGLCLHFNQGLSRAEGLKWGDYVTLAPAATPSFSATDARLCLTGLAAATSYTVTLKAGLPADGEARLAADETITVNTGDKAPHVSFAGNGFVLPRVGAQGVPVETINVSRVRVDVVRLDDRVVAERFGWSLRSNETLVDYDLRRAAFDTGFVEWSGTMEVASVPNERVVTSFDIGSVLLARRPGAYLVRVADASPERASPAPAEDVDAYGYDEPRRILAVIHTDLALTSFRGEDGLLAVARSLDTARPLGNVELALLGQSGQRLGTARTDAEGRARFPAGLMNGGGSNAPTMLMGFGEGGDFALHNLERSGFDFADRGVGGRVVASMLDLFLYADRGIYRPGETIELAALARNRVAEAVSEPLTLVVTRPSGTEFRRLVNVTPDAGGFVHVPISLPADAQRGTWTVSAYTDPKAPPVGRLRVAVQDFVPERIAVDGRAETPLWAPGETVAVAISGRYLYGAEAARLPTTAEIRLAPDPTPFPDLEGWRFGRLDDPFRQQRVELDPPDTDERGQARVTTTLGDADATTLPLEAVVTVGVVEPGGRVTRNRFTVPYRNRDVLLGIKPGFANDSLGGAAEAALTIGAFDREGRPVARPGVKLTLVTEDWGYYWFETDGRWDFRRLINDTPVRTETVDLPAEGYAFRHVVDGWGRYRLTVEDPATGAVTSYRFASGFTSSDPESDSPDRLQVAAEKPTYAIGETARLRIQAGVAGRALLTLAAETVREVREIEVPAGGTTIDIPVTAEWGAGTYALVNFYRPIDGGDTRQPVRSVGLTWIGIDNAARTLQVALAAPDVIAPQTTLTVPVAVTGGVAGETVTVTVAAVDEGVLRLTDFATPAPDAWFFGKRLLGVLQRDEYGRLLDGHAGPQGRLREGGDGLGGTGLTVVPTRTVALFSGPVTLGPDGTGSVSFEVPDFVGELRLMAVAWDRTRVGHGEARTKVRTPLVADGFFPRFLAPGDTGTATFAFHNLDGPVGTYEVSLTAEGPVALDGAASRSLAFARDARETWALPLRASDVGIGTIRLTVTGPEGVAFARSWQIESRNPHYPLTFEEPGTQPPNATFRVEPRLVDAFLPNSLEVSVNYGTVAGIDIPGLLQSLDRYPYGCTEQTISRAAPLLAFEDFRLLRRIATPDDATAERNRRVSVQAAVDTVVGRQTLEGAFGLWGPESEEAPPWVNIAAVEFLKRARDRDYIVPDQALALGTAYLERLVTGGYDYRYQPTEYNLDANRTYAGWKAYANQVLSQFGRPNLGELRVLNQRFGERLDTAATPALMAAAFSAGGEAPLAAALFERGRLNIGAANRIDWYASPLRDAAMLTALAAESGQTALLPQLTRPLADLAKPPSRANTQEAYWMLRAAHALANRAGATRIAVNGVEPAGLATPGGTVSFQPTADQIRAGYELTNLSGGEAFRMLVIHGAPRSAPPPLANGFALQRRWFSLDGTLLDPTTTALPQQSRLIVSISGTVLFDEFHQAILVDLLPAGWEIEQVLAPPVPAYDEEGNEIEVAPLYPFLPPITEAGVREARDDRFVAALGFGRQFHQAYIVRLVTPGDFVLPAAVVEDMYRPAEMARTAAARTRVTPAE